MTKAANTFNISQDLLDGLIASLGTSVPFLSDLDKADKIISRVGLKDKVRSANKDPNAELEVKLPVVLPEVNTYHGKLCKTYLNKNPIFQAVSINQEHQDAAEGMNKLILEYQRVSKWNVELSNSFLSMARNNIAAMEVSFVKGSQPDFSNKNSADIINTLALNSYIRLTNIPVKDLIIPFLGDDSGIDYNSYSSELDYIGYKKKITTSSLVKLLTSLPYFKVTTSQGETYSNKTLDDIKLLASSRAKPTYSNLGGSYLNWELATLGSTSADSKLPFSKANTVNPFNSTSVSHTLTTVYARHPIEKEGKIKVVIYKLLILNDKYLLSSEVLDLSLLPIIICTPDTSFTSNPLHASFPFMLEDIQYTASYLYSADTSGIGQAVRPTTYFDPAVLPGLDKYPRGSVIPFGRNSSPEERARAYLSIANIDSTLGQKFNVANNIASNASAITGINKASQGSFIRGNKTDSQFEETLQATENRLLPLYLVISSVFMASIGQLIKELILTSVDISEVSRFLGATASDAITRFKAEGTSSLIQIGDGFQTDDSIVGITALYELLKTPQFIEVLKTEGYSITKLIEYVMSVTGANLTNFKPKVTEDGADTTTTIGLDQGLANGTSGEGDPTGITI